MGRGGEPAIETEIERLAEEIERERKSTHLLAHRPNGSNGRVLFRLNLET